VKPFRAILLLIFILCGASRCLALDGESVPRIPFPEIVRGNFSSLDIMPFRLRVVGTSYGEWADYTEKTVGNRSEEGFRTSLFGGTLGTDWLLSENCLVGFHAASGHVDINPEAAGYDGSITSVGGVARLSLSETRWYWDASLGVGRNRNRAESLLDGHFYAGNKDLTQVNYQTELGLKMSSGFTRIEPLVGFRYITLSAGGLNPYDPLSQSYLSTPESFRSLLGSRFAWEYATKISTIRPTLRGIWVHEFRDKTVFTSDDTFLFPIAGEFGGKMFPRDRAVLGAGVSAAMRDMVDLFFDYSCAFAPDNVSYSVSGGFHVKY
jgi:outer membrane autotransporter protein